MSMRIIPKAMKLCRLMIGLQPISGLLRWIGGEACRGKVSGIVPLSTRKKFAFVGGLSSFSPSIKAEWVQVLPTARIGRAQLYRARSASTGTTPCCSVPYVPISQLAKYFTCSFVSVSIFIPMPASLSRAISLSITGGTG